MTQSAPITIGSYVQYNAAYDSPRAAAPSFAEQTIGIVRQVINSQNEPYYQVVWNPGGNRPKVGMYHAQQLTVVDAQTASGILQELAAGTFTPAPTNQSSQYQQPNIPAQALPPSLQNTGTTFAPAPGVTPTSIQETS